MREEAYRRSSEPLIGFRLWTLKGEEDDNLYPANNIGPVWASNGSTRALCLFDNYERFFGPSSYFATPTVTPVPPAPTMATNVSNWAVPSNHYVVQMRYDYPQPRHVDKQAPVWNCTCGLYAFCKPTDFGLNLRASLLHEQAILGAVMGWGRVIVHGDPTEHDILVYGQSHPMQGFRTEYAQPVAFMVHTPQQHRIASRYGARQVSNSDALIDAASEFGVTLEKVLGS